MKSKFIAMEIDILKQRIVPILKKYHVSRAGIFGSVAKQQEHSSSDVDILVEINEPISLLDFIGIKLELEDALGMNVDLVEYKSLKPQLREGILNEQVPVL